MHDYQAIVFSCLAAIVGIYAIRWYNNPLRAIPTVGGSSLPGLSYLGAIRMQGDCRDVLREGYQKYPNSAFKVALLDKWMVFVSGRSMVEELRKRPNDELSSQGGSQEFQQSRYSCETVILDDDYHVDVIKENFTRKLPAMLPDLIDEVSVAARDQIAASENDWTSTEVLPAMRTIVARASNRAFVGLPLCRNKTYLTLMVDFSVNVMKGAVILRLCPRLLKPLVALFVKPLFVNSDTYRAEAYLRPIIEGRQRAMLELGEGWNDKPNDLLQFLLDKAATRNETMFIIAQRLLAMNFAAIHTSSMTVTHALFHLAEDPALVAALREEVETAIAADGWTAVALGNMWQLDSLLRETVRYYGISLSSMTRRAMKDIVLADGTRLPEGTLVAAPSYAMHHDDALCAGAGAFDPFRFARMRRGAADQLAGARLQFTSTSPEYIPFGHGPQACPGRYFASNELKAILAHVVLNYDMKLGGDGTRPSPLHAAMHVTPDARGCVLFRKRSPRSEGPGSV